MASPDCGETMQYDPTWAGPVKISRKKTDPRALKCYLVFFAIWLIIGLFSVATYTYDFHKNMSKNALLFHNRLDINWKNIDHLTPSLPYHMSNPINYKGTYENFENENQYLENTGYPMKTIDSEKIPSPMGVIGLAPSLFFFVFFHHQIAARSILITTFVTAWLAVVYTMSMRAAKVIFWGVICFTTVSLILILVISITLPTEKYFKNFGQFYLNINYTVSNLKIILFLSIAFTLFIQTGFCIYFYKKINIACEVITEASKSMWFFPSHWFLVALQFVLCLTVFFIFTCTASRINEITDGILCFLLQFFNFFTSSWTRFFINGTKHMIMSSSYASWYWTMDKKRVPDKTVITSISNVKRYHLGTVAFGSVVMSICDIINSVVEKIKKEAGENGSNQWVTHIFSCGCQGFLSAVMYIIRNAYVMCAVHGTDFMTSAKDVFNIIKRNLAKTIITTQVTGYIFGFGKVIIFLVANFLAWAILDPKRVIPKADQGLVMIGGWLSSSAFSIMLASAIFDVLTPAIDTVYISVIEDYERNDATNARPFYMSKKLKSLFLKEEIFLSEINHA